MLEVRWIPGGDDAGWGDVKWSRWTDVGEASNSAHRFCLPPPRSGCLEPFERDHVRDILRTLCRRLVLQQVVQSDHRACHTGTEARLDVVSPASARTNDERRSRKSSLTALTSCEPIGLLAHVPGCRCAFFLRNFSPEQRIPLGLRLCIGEIEDTNRPPGARLPPLVNASA